MSNNEVLMCTEFPETPAVMRYRWPWDGEWKACSANGQRLLRQKAERLKQNVEFLPLGDPNPEAQPLERSERQQLHAARLAAEDELKDARARSTQLYQQTVDLTADIRQAKRESEQLRADLKTKVDALAENERARATMGTKIMQLTEELQRANRLVAQETGAADELASQKAQLDSAQAQLASVQAELNATKEKHELRVNELLREIEAAKASRTDP